MNAVAGNAIANALIQNDYLKILDLAWNQIGQRPQEDRAGIKRLSKDAKPMKVGEIGAAWSGCFRENGVLVHLDISFN